MHSRAANFVYGLRIRGLAVFITKRSNESRWRNARSGDQRIDWHQGLTDIFEAWMLSRSGRLLVPDLWRFLPKLGGAAAPPFLFLGGTVNSYRASRPGLGAYSA